MKRILGLCDSVTTCECCGRTNLKSTVVIGDEFGESFYGSVCASRYLGGSGSTKAGKEVVAKAQQNEVKIQNAKELVARLWSTYESKERINGKGRAQWVNWLNTNSGVLQFHPDANMVELFWNCFNQAANIYQNTK